MRAGGQGKRGHRGLRCGGEGSGMAWVHESRRWLRDLRDLVRGAATL
jgi:hypothetical protein